MSAAEDSVAVRRQGHDYVSMLCVVPDSNQLFGQLTAGPPRSAWQQLLDLSAGGQIRLTIPEVVQWELTNQLREDAEKKLGAHRLATERLRTMGLEPPGFGSGPTDLEALLTQASEGMRQELLAHGGEILPLPNVDHSELVRRSLRRDPPFDQRDRGYRDSLIWHTVLDLVREGEEILLISADGRAFCAAPESKELHPSLVEEVEAICGERRRVRLRRDMSSALSFVRERTSLVRDAAEQALADDDLVGELIVAMIAGADGHTLDQRQLYAQGWPSLLGVRVYPTDRIGGLAVEKAVTLADGALDVLVSLVALVELDVRWLGDFESDDDLAMIASGTLIDCGIGFLDGLFQLHVARDAEILCAVRLEPETEGDIELNARSWRLGEVNVRDVRISRRDSGGGQLTLDLEMHPMR